MTNENTARRHTDRTGRLSADGGRSRQGPTVAVATFVGTTIEWYDFFVYATAAALVFGPQFFPQLSATAASLASFATFGVAFVSRPLGGVVFGHLGDIVGRKAMLVASLLMMGAATFGIGLLPNYAAIGMAAPILLVVLRLLQGIAVGGEWGGAVLMALEHAPPGERGRYSSWPQAGVGAGLALSSTVYLVLALALPTSAYTAWAWRLPFLLSATLVLVGIIVRIKLEESPLFRAVTKVRQPAIAVIRQGPGTIGWAALTYVGSSATFYLTTVYLVSYISGKAGLAQTDVLAALLVAAVVLTVSTYLCGLLIDRIGPARVLLLGAAITAVLAFPVALAATSILGLFLGLAAIAVANAALYAPLGIFFADLFPTPLRYSGSSIAYQLGAVLGGAFAPLIATALVGRFGITSIAVYIMAAVAVTAVAVPRALSRARAHDGA